MNFHAIVAELFRKVRRTFLGIKNLNLGIVPFMPRQACNLPETLPHNILGFSA